MSDLGGFLGSKTQLICVHGPRAFQGRKHMFMVLNHRLNMDLEARKVVRQVRKVTLMKWSFNLMILDLKFGLRREVRERE